MVGILRSGRLRVEQEGVVSGILRICAAELSDLVEQNQGSGSGSGATQDKEGTPGLTSGPPPVAPPADAPAAEKNDSEYSYETDEEEEESLEKKPEDTKENIPLPPPVPEGTGDSASLTVEADPDKGRDSDKGEAYKEKVRGKFDPHYLTKRLCLTPAPKPHSGGSRDKRRRESPVRPREKEGAVSREDKGARSAPASGGHSPARRHDDEQSDTREPLVRRPPEGKRKRERGTKGQRKKERAREFRAKKIEERRAKKAQRDQECRQKPKRRQW